MRKNIIWFLLFLVIVFRYYSFRPVYKEADTVRISSVVAGEPVIYDSSQKISLLGLNFYLPKYPEVGYGDRVVVEGKVVVKKGKYWLEKANLISLTTTQGVLPLFRKKVIGFYKKTLPEPHSSLVAGVTLGSKADIPQDFRDELKTTGVTHVIVASGMNVTLVAGFFLSSLLLFVPRRKAIIIAFIGVWGYSFMAGFDAPIVRAAVMVSMLFVAQMFGRVASGIEILISSAILMLIIKTEWLVDLGFWLSFCATASLMVFGKAFERFCRKVPGLLREGLSTSLAAQIGVSPILYYMFGYVSIVSPLVNALVLWTIPYITIIGMVSGVLGVIIEPLGRLVLYLAYPLTAWFVFVIRVFA